MQLTFIRHTSVAVPKGICYGKTDVPLAGTFGNEAAQILENLNSERFDAVFSSPLSRYTKLAYEVFHDMEIITDRRLSELDFGAWEIFEWDSIFETRHGKEWFNDYVKTACLEGESFADLILRCESFLKFTRSSDFHNIAIVTHAGVIRAMLSLLQDISPEDTFYVPINFGQIIKLSNECQK